MESAVLPGHDDLLSRHLVTLVVRAGLPSRFGHDDALGQVLGLLARGAGRVGLVGRMRRIGGFLDIRGIRGACAQRARDRLRLPVPRRPLAVPGGLAGSVVGSSAWSDGCAGSMEPSAPGEPRASSGVMPTRSSLVLFLAYQK